MKTIPMLILSAALFFGCGESKPVKLSRLRLGGPTRNVVVVGEVAGVNTAITVLKVGDKQLSNIEIKDDTDQLTFYFDPANFTRQPQAGDKIKMTCNYVFMSEQSAVGGRAGVIEKIEWR